MHIVNTGRWVRGQPRFGNPQWMQMCPAALEAARLAQKCRWNGHLWRKCQQRGSGHCSGVSCCVSALGSLPAPPLPSIQPLQVYEDCSAPIRALGRSLKKMNRDEYFMAFD